MNINKVLKSSLIAIAIAVMLVFPIALGWTSAAADTNQAETTDGRAQLYMDYLGLATSSLNRGPQDTPQAQPLFTQDNAGKVFWIGIRVDDASKAEFLKNGGLRDLEIGIEYNTNYVEPCINPGDPDVKGDKDKWTETIKKFNMGDGDKLTWKSTDYEFKSEYSSYEANPDDVDGRVDDAEADWKMQFISIMKKDGVTGNNRFQGLTDDTDDGYYLIRLPFKFKNAPTDSKVPEVFRLSLGPSSFVMTSGSGYSTTDTLTYAWEDQDRTDKAHNLGNYFKYNNNLNLFVGDETMTSLEVSYIKLNENNKKEKEVLELYRDAKRQNTPQAYEPSCYTYYVAVPDGTSELRLVMSKLATEPVIGYYDYGAESPTPIEVKANEEASIAGKWLARVPLVTTEKSVYKETIKIIVDKDGDNEKSYYINVFHETDMVDPVITLKPGNSPYGMIERMAEEYHGADGAWDVGKIQRAKEAFAVNNSYAEGLVPDGGDAGIIYSPSAWFGGALDDMETVGENIDQNVTAQIVFNKTPFVDAGFEIIDSAGNTVADEDVKRRIKIKAMASSGVDFIADSLVTEEIVEFTVTNDDKTMNFADAGYSYVRPGVYEMEYLIDDPANGADYKVGSRKFVLLWELGDVNLSVDSDQGDIDSLIFMNSGEFAPYAVGVAKDVEYIHQYRIVDVNASGDVDNGDVDSLRYINAGELSLIVYYINFAE